MLIYYQKIKKIKKIKFIPISNMSINTNVVNLPKKYLNKDIEKLLINAKAKYSGIAKIINNVNTSLEEKQNQLYKFDYINNLNVPVPNQQFLDLKQVFKIYYDKVDFHLKKNYSNQPHLINKDLLKFFTLLKHKKNSRNNAILICFICLADIVNAKANEEGASIRYNKVFGYLKNRYKSQYNFLISENPIFNKDNEEVYINFVASLLDACTEAGVLEIETIFASDLKKKIKYIKFDKQMFKVLDILGLEGKKLPRLILKKRSYNELGYIHNAFLEETEKEQLIHFNIEKSLKTTLGDQVLSNVSYIESIPCYVDKELLDEYSSNIYKYLYRFTKFNFLEHLEKYEDFADYVNRTEVWQTVRRKKIEEYQNYLNKAKLFIENLEVSRILLGYELYFKVFLDFRGRLYYHGYPVTHHVPGLLRNLLQISTTGGKQVRLDAHASGFQMFGLILKNSELLLMTNILKDKNNPCKNNLYQIYLDKFLKKFKHTISLKLMKQILIQFAYNQGSRERKTLIVNNLWDGKSSYNQLKKVADDMELFLNNEFKEIKEFQNIVKIIVNHKPGKLKLLENEEWLSTSQLYALQESKTTSYKNLSNGNRKKITLKYDIEPFKPNKRKARIATLPNLVHGIDALVLHKVIQKCSLKNIKVFTAHDCFTVLEIHKATINKFYIESIQEIAALNLGVNFIKNNITEELRKSKKHITIIETFLKKSDNIFISWENVNYDDVLNEEN